MQAIFLLLCLAVCFPSVDAQLPASSREPLYGLRNEDAVSAMNPANPSTGEGNMRKEMITSSSNRRLLQENKLGRSANIFEREALGYYQNIFEESLTSRNFTLLSTGVSQVPLPDGTNRTFRHLDIFYPFVVSLPQFGIEPLLGALLAAHHFNNRIPTVVPRLKELGECDIAFSLDVWNTLGNPINASRYLTDQVLPRGEKGASQEDKAKYPTGLLGEFLSSVSQPLAIFSGINKVTQVSFGSSSTVLDYKDIYPYFGRVVTSVDYTANVAAQYFVKELKATNVYMIYTRDAFGIDYARSFQQHAAENKLVTNSYSISPSCVDHNKCKDFQNALLDLRASGVRYVFAILQDLTIRHYQTLVSMASTEKLVGDDFFWMFSYTLGSQFQVNETLALATNGSATVRSIEGDLLDAFSTYKQEWKKYIHTDEAREILYDLLKPSLNASGQLEAFANYSIPEVSAGSVFSYDSFMSLALAACSASTRFGSNFSKEEFHDTWIKSDFMGATGNVRFDPATGSRLQQTIPATIANYLASSTPGADEKYTIRSVDTHIYNESAWHRLQGAPEFIYASGSTTPPSALPPLTVSEDEIQTWASILGYVATVLIVIITLGFCVWMQYHSNDDPIRATQVFFVWMLGIGVCLMAISLIPQAALASSTMPNAACMISPWFLSIGFCVTFAALFSKLMRINNIDLSSKKMVRVNIKPYMVLKPFVVLLCLNLIILITWTAVAPLKYMATATGSVDSFGREISFTISCQSDDAIWFRIVIGILDAVALFAAFYQSWRARKVKMAYNESNLIFLGLLISSQSFFIGVPGVVAASGNPTTEFVSRVLAVTWGCLGIILPICFPKIGQLKKWRKDLEEKEMRRQERLERNNKFFENASGSSKRSSLPTKSASLSTELKTGPSENDLA
jgi:ABC-type branched-subunit amino acid transport system substrate-binding protein